MNKNYYVGKLNFKQNIKLLLLHPVSPASGILEPIPLKGHEYLLDSTTVDGLACEGAPKSIFNDEDAKAATPFIVEKTKWAECQNYDAIVINCMIDPGLSEARSAVKIPVIGLKQATLSASSLVGNNPKIIYPSKIPILELADDEEKTFNALVEEGKNKIKEDSADVLILGCAYVGQLAQRLQEELNVPVLSNTDVGLKFAEFLATFQIKKGLGQLNSTLKNS